jgi:hypothetical protein
LRVALIAVGERGAEPWPAVAGRPLVLRQFDFVRACGVERVIAYGNGAREDAEALRLACARARIAYAGITSAHALVALVEWTDELIVLQPGLLPEAGAAIAALRRGERILSFSAGAVRGGPLERIDAANLWSGALVMPGALVDQLEQLPEDADPHAALLRIALQSHLPLDQLPADLVSAGWTRVRPGADEAAIATQRVKRLLSPVGAWQPSRWVAERLSTRLAVPLAERRFVVAGAVTLALLLLGGALAGAWYGYAALAFAAIALAVPALHLARLVERVRRAAFLLPRLPRWLGFVPDAALLAVGTLAIDGAWYRQLFPPLVLLLALNSTALGRHWGALVSDRAVGVLLVAGAALGGAVEPALMAWALVALAAGALPPFLAERRGG